MSNTHVMILEGSNGQSFFLKETLLAQSLAEDVELVNNADQAISRLKDEPYDLVVINLVEAWEQGMKLCFWLSERPGLCQTILIISPELNRALPTNGSFVVLTEPVSLREFAERVRSVLQPGNGTAVSHKPIYLKTELPSLPSWSGEPLHQEYVGYWSTYADSFLS